MLDEVDFEDLSDLERDEWMDSQSIFSEQEPSEQEPSEQPAEPDVAVTAPAQEPVSAPAPEVETPPAPKLPEPEAQAPIPAEPVAVSAEPIAPPLPAETMEMPPEVPEPEPVQKNEQARPAPLAAAKLRQEITQKATVGLSKAMKQTSKRTLLPRAAW